MSINVIISFQALPEQATAFASLLEQVRQDLPNAPGCRAVRVLRRADRPCLFTLVEQWESEAQHQAHLSHVTASGDWDRIAAHLAAAPLSHYYIEEATAG